MEKLSSEGNKLNSWTLTCMTVTLRSLLNTISFRFRFTGMQIFPDWLSPDLHYYSLPLSSLDPRQQSGY